MDAASYALAQGNRNPYARYFGLAVKLGVLVNLLLAVPGVFFPEQVLAIFGLDPAVPDVWPRFAAWLLILLSLFYIPPASSPFHSPASSWLTVVARVAGVVFFAVAVPTLGLNVRFLLFGLLDLVFALPQGIFLALAFRARKLELSRH